MSIVRRLLLAGSQNRWLQRQAMRRGFVRKAVSRFMPGETLDDAVAAARELETHGLGTILTHLGENVTERAEADAEAEHYLDVIERSASLDCEVSVKLTQLGLDLDPERPHRHLIRLIERAAELKRTIWIDMEGSAYTERTIEVYRRLRRVHPNVGVAIQAYLRRSRADVESLLPLGAAIRLVKGAYREPASIAFASLAEVNENYFALARLLLAPEARGAGARLVAGTHDTRLIARINEYAEATGVPRGAFEYAMLYGIRRDEQERLARSGYPTRVLISYGSSWFPWYMRRLAERPANLMFVAKSLFQG